MRCLLVGYYGFGNVGDEWLLHQTRRLLEDVYANPSIWVLHQQYQQHPTFLNRWSVLSVIKGVRLSDAVIFGGGGLFQNVTSNRSLLYYLSIFILAKLLRKKVMVLSQGVGPLKGQFAHSVTSFLLSKSTILTVRDEHSLSLVSKQAYLASDLAYYGQELTPIQKSITPYIGVSLRSWVGLHRYKTVLEDVFERLPLTPVFMSFHDKEDMRIVNDFAFSVLKHKQVDMMPYCETNKTFPADITMIIAMRYHACVWASLHGIPFLALVYDDKVKQLAESLKQPYIDLRDRQLSYFDISNQVNQFLEDYETYQLHILNLIPDLIDRANKQKALLKAV